MSDIHEPVDGEQGVFDGVREWAVYRCGHGCLHVTLDRLMLTFTEIEFHALQDLMRRACERFHREITTTAEARAH
jgi:hypothetical protein